MDKRHREDTRDLTQGRISSQVKEEESMVGGCWVNMRWLRTLTQQLHAFKQLLISFALIVALVTSWICSSFHLTPLPRVKRFKELTMQFTSLETVMTQCNKL